ncbi:single-stranded DNA-binding protein [Clostridium sp. DL1XJH146]
MNKVILVGRITKDLELKEIGEDKIPFVNFHLAVTSGYKKSTGEKIVDFIPVCAWSRNAENLYKYTGKGTLLSVVGNLKIRTYKTDEGSNKYVAEVRAERIQFLERKKQEEKGQDEII